LASPARRKKIHFSFEQRLLIDAIIVDAAAAVPRLARENRLGWEAELSQGIEPGGRTALEKAYTVHKDRLLTLAAALTGNLSAAEDVMHDVFALLIERGWIQPDGRNLSSYLSVCVRSRSYDFHRGKRRRKRLCETGTKGSLKEAPDDPSDETARNEETEIVLRILNELPGGLRETVALRIWGGLTFDKIAALQGVAKSTAHTRYHNALVKLKLKLGRLLP